jgi:hypothetical protein
MPRPDSSVVERGPEKAGVGGSIPSLATTFSTTYNPSSTDYVPTARRSRSTPTPCIIDGTGKSSAAWDTKFSKTDIFCDARRGWLGTINSTGCRRTGTFYESLRGAAFLDIFLLTHLADIDSTAMHNIKQPARDPVSPESHLPRPKAFPRSAHVSTDIAREGSPHSTRH